MEIITLSAKTVGLNAQAAIMLADAFPHSYKDSAAKEIKGCLKSGKLCLGAVDGEKLLGFVGAMPQYGITGWELHPLVVDKHCRRKGVGRALCTELEQRLRQKGCITVYLGSDDEFGSTSLYGTDLFADTYEKIAQIQNLKGHPYEFYQKVGYKIVGVMPDANGIGKPDIWLAKSLVR